MRSVPVPAAQEAEEQDPGKSVSDGKPRHELELALSNESFWLSYRSPVRRGEGYLSLGFLANER